MTLFLLISCHNKKDSTVVTYDGLDLISKDIKLDLSDYFTDIEYIIPEFLLDAIPGSYSSVKIIEDHLLIHDNLDRLFIYSRNGSFVGIISNQGRGPGEYKTIIDFTLLNDEIYLIDDALRVLKYKTTGEFISGIRLDVPQLGISRFYDNIMTYTMPPWSVENDWYKLTLYDKNMKVLNRCYQGVKDEKLKESIPNIFFRMYEFDGVYSLWEGDSDTIFRLTEDFQIYPEIALDFGSKKDISSNEKVYDAESYRSFSLIETSKYFFMICRYENQGKSFLLDRTTGTGGNVVFNYDIIDHGFHNDIDGGYPFWPKGVSDKGELFTWFDPLWFKLKYNNEYFRTIKVKDSARAEYLESVLNGAGENTNSIIMICK